MRDLSLGVSSCGAGSVVAEHGVSCFAACEISVPWPGTEPVNPALQGGFFITEPPGKSPALTLTLIAFLSKHISNIYEQVPFMSAGEWMKMRKWCLWKMALLSPLCSASWPEDCQRESPVHWHRLRGACLSAFFSMRLLPPLKHLVGNMGMGCQVWC